MDQYIIGWTPIRTDPSVGHFASSTPLDPGQLFWCSGLIRIKVRKRTKIRNRYNQAPHLTKDTNVTTSQLNITNESQEVSPFTAGDLKAHQQTDVHKCITKQDRNNMNDPQKKHCLRTVSKNILLEGLHQYNGATTLPLVHMWIKTHRCLVCMKDP